MRPPSHGASAALVVLSWGALARAQGLPPLPPPAAEPRPPAPAPPAPPGEGPPGEEAQPPRYRPPPPPVEAPPASPARPPPRLVLVEAEPPGPHAPPFSLWVGGRLGLLMYWGGLYVNDTATGSVETTGNFVKPGLGAEVDVGARLGWRYIPYLAFEWGLVPPGHRFEGATASTSANTSFLGGGFRYLAGNVDAISFASDISFGVRKFQVTSGSSTYTLSSVEIFRLGLGAEIRMSNAATLSPMVTFSAGAITDTSGNVSFAPNQGDGQQSPPFTGNGNIPGWAQTSYYAIVLGLGAHVDLFGK